MADTAKTTKSVAKKTVKKVAPVVKSVDELRKDLVAKQNDLLEAKRGHRAGELVNPRAITASRKEVARIKTAIRALELKGDK